MGRIHSFPSRVPWTWPPRGARVGEGKGGKTQTSLQEAIRPELLAGDPGQRPSRQPWSPVEGPARSSSGSALWRRLGMERAGRARSSEQSQGWRGGQGPGQGSTFAHSPGGVSPGASTLFVCTSAKVLPRVNLCFTTYFQADFSANMSVLAHTHALPRPRG